MEFTAAKRNIDIKFDFKTMFKINNKLGTINPETGERNADGVGALFFNILEPLLTLCVYLREAEKKR